MSDTKTTPAVCKSYSEVYQSSTLGCFSHTYVQVDTGIPSTPCSEEVYLTTPLLRGESFCFAPHTTSAISSDWLLSEVRVSQCALLQSEMYHGLPCPAVLAAKDYTAAGGTVLALSIWLAVDNTSFLILTRVSENDSLQEFNQPSVLEHGAYILIVAGGLVFCIGFLGCCGAVLESRVLLTIYGLTIIVIFLLEVTGGALAAVYKAETEEELQNFLKLTLKKYYSTQSTANSMTVSWNALMAELKCCGVNNYTDFELASMWQTNKTDGMVMPVACCILEGDPKKFKPLDPSCVSDPTPENSYFLTGCLGRLQENTFYYLPTMLSVAIGLGTLQLILITLSFYMCRAIGKALKVATVD
ncbi:LOW QUALITY PROTEIN: tetraspanin-1-like [Palaemon carinicauda]|uniref:LOW QUALITY PROTEIN: tetraspanin-1-like n=1 Tax=Palaemon carinicauda TaxID=392227 RepID=UPI0035B6319A